MNFVQNNYPKDYLCNFQSSKTGKVKRSFNFFSVSIFFSCFKSSDFIIFSKSLLPILQYYSIILDNNVRSSVVHLASLSNESNGTTSVLGRSFLMTGCQYSCRMNGTLWQLVCRAGVASIMFHSFLPAPG